ncbi:DNA-binding MarR family transcriptional regulator [Rhodopirellula rubra]|uniref:DNA-binding MarR family transcriptional regulator n=1 Tax=Aporhodopirellula rubra TaxID=980271 RepID=A0A7W5E210_9BACT|nr:AAA family ATPase [Aporhodopirellula rubra]MBB3208324.1 DNA-binding MarR family transcriptional regulator [Aporhodopirellula rubra]
MPNPQQGSTSANRPSPSASDAVDSQLDALINRIQSLSGDPSAKGEKSPPDSVVPRTGQPSSAANRTGVPQPSAASVQNPATAGQASQPPLASGPSAQPPAQSRPSGNPARARQSIPIGYQPNRDEPWRPLEPTDIQTNRISETLLEAIMFRYILNTGEAEGRRIAEQVQLPFRMIEPILERFKKDQQVAYKSSTATNDYVYVLTESGRAIARNHLNDSTYYGSCPVRLNEYIDSIKRQSIEGQFPKRKDLLKAFSDLLINPKMLERLGPAVASGRGMFLFGFPGNGKTSIAERVTGAFGKYIWIPRSVDIDGDILRVYDPMNHVAAMPESSTGLLDAGGFDKRWVRIERPTIIAGGELTMEMLEVLNNPTSNISEAPLQMKSNCGTLVIDDFGRQKMSVDQLLNRWIIPLEKRYDFLNMASGKKIQVPFDQLVIFSTNLEPKDLVDDAFLRRIPYKIEVENPPESDFRKLFEIMCRVTKIPYNADAVDYLIKTHYLPVNRPFRNCQPRDLLLQVRNYCLYNDLEVQLKNEYFDFACDNYFSVM